MPDLFVLDDSAAIYLFGGTGHQISILIGECWLDFHWLFPQTSFQAAWENAKLLNMGVSKNRGIWKPPKWMVKIMENQPYEQMDDLGR